ncbi:oligosaccharide flippase family protein [Niabella insulamsoli]|uniref:oligosaccharide flippase family protein n=1 Tax=Niabella insulamsoli TaxID=3144874 RepID=UPI0031FBAF75
MSGIKKLAGQTIWYGVSSIAARFINYLLTPYLTYKFTTGEYGEMSILYAFIPFMNVIFTYGMETGFFRFSQNYDKDKVYSTTSLSLIYSTLILTLALIAFNKPLSQLLSVADKPEYLMLVAAIIAMDALTTIPFAKLRQNGQPRKFAFTKLTGIIVNIITIYFFLSICPKLIEQEPDHVLSHFYNKDWAVGYVLLANLIQNVIVFLILSKEFWGFKFNLNKSLWKEMMGYSLPLILVGLGGMINETADRIMLLKWWQPTGGVEDAESAVGIYAACYKLSILISLGVQAFKMGAEPFFFSQSSSENAPRIYARVMKFFVITVCLMFLFVVLYLDIWKYFIRNTEMWVGLSVVPILLLANMFLGIYYNLSIWYKLGNRTIAGAYITLIGAAITILINYIFIPYYGYLACAWATFSCYGVMMIISYVWGQKKYRIPYATSKLIAYIIIAVIFYAIHHFVKLAFPNAWINYGVATLVFILYFLFIVQVEKKEFAQLPVIGRFLRPKLKND